MAVPFGILVAIYTSEFAGPRSGFAIRYVLDMNARVVLSEGKEKVTEKRAAADFLAQKFNVQVEVEDETTVRELKPDFAALGRVQAGGEQ